MKEKTLFPHSKEGKESVFLNLSRLVQYFGEEGGEWRDQNPSSLNFRLRPILGGFRGEGR